MCFLGGLSKGISGESPDLNNYTEPGVIYTWAATIPENAPCAYGAMMNLFRVSRTYSLQVVLYRNNVNPRIWIRFYDGSSGGWGNWFEITKVQVS